MKTLECHSKGDTRFSPFFCDVKVFGINKSIENHYHCSKVFETPTGKIVFPNDWRQSKKLAKSGAKQVAWQISEMMFPIRSDATGRYAIDDFGVQWYCCLWYKHLRENPWKVEYVKEFDEFNDPFAGKFPFCQAKVMEKVKNEGLYGLRGMATELWQLLHQDLAGGLKIIRANLLDMEYGMICHQVNLKGVMGAGLAKQIRDKYPQVYQQYKNCLENKSLGDILAVSVADNLMVLNLFAQTDIGTGQQQTNMTALKECCAAVRRFNRDWDYMMPIYLPYNLGCGLGGANWSEVSKLIEEELHTSIICRI
ncbi:hypothetical protein NG799_01805 [Laspinema sp. D1]|uniref:Macro domain-containing protein n=1 Tax=Laspinema palackyanum D2a TaxID=2953684 RepID=A0ABT2MJZ8_9CYAN|nr:hypothetical protein [Laspinema sp. D2a]